MEQMQNVMNGLANIMGNAKNKIKVQEFQKSMKTYTTEKERMQAMNEMIQDTMEMGEDEIDDNDVDKLIMGMEDEVHKKKMAQAEMQADEEELWFPIHSNLYSSELIGSIIAITQLGNLLMGKP